MGRVNAMWQDEQERSYQCAYCGADEDLRSQSGFHGPNNQPDWICEKCFTPKDTGPCFDDLPTGEDNCDRRYDEMRDRQGE